MANKKKSKKAPSATIVLNRKARHDFHIEDRIEAGVVLEGWEVKSLEYRLRKLLLKRET